MTDPTALAGIRVLDFTRVLAGPFCTMMLADLGADVIKVEQPGKGDDTRHWGPPWVGDMSAYFASVNRNKRSLTLNLKHPEGQLLARRLIASSDVVIENFKVGQMAEFGLSYDDVRPLNASLVYCSITGFGQTGPYKDRPGYDYVVQGMSGLMSITGEKEGRPAKVGVAISDVIAGLHANVAIQAALRHAARTGSGQYIDISLLDSQVAALVNVASNYLVSGEVPSRYGNQHQNIVPYQTFEAQDGEFVVACGNDRQFRLLCHIIQMPELADDNRFETNPQRVENRQALIAILREAFLSKSVEDWVVLLTDAGIPAGSINTVEQALNDPQMVARDLVQEMELRSDKILRFVASPLKLSHTPPAYTLPPPALGADTDAVLRDLLGLSASEIADYHRESVI